MREIEKVEKMVNEEREQDKKRPKCKAIPSLNAANSVVCHAVNIRRIAVTVFGKLGS